MVLAVQQAQKVIEANQALQANKALQERRRLKVLPDLQVQLVQLDP
jgi:hypothetical protein